MIRVFFASSLWSQDQWSNGGQWRRREQKSSCPSLASTVGWADSSFAKEQLSHRFVCIAIHFLTMTAILNSQAYRKHTEEGDGEKSKIREKENWERVVLVMSYKIINNGN